MCGICGILNRDSSRPVSTDRLQAMTDAIIHRGPDDAGFFVHRNIGLGMRRLSVIDVAGGQQPQHNENDTCHIVFNGEIYNYPDLRKQCDIKGHHFATQSDTETIVHLYEDHGPDCVKALNGMFAFAIYDGRNDRVVIARDRLGIKPLYYAETREHFLFASEIKALLQHPAVSRDIDPIALNQYLTYKYVPGPRTIFKQIRQLPPGHFLIWESGKIQIRPYWTLSFEAAPQRHEADIAEELHDRLKTAVQMQMLSDVPLGALLSGGIDSSLIVGLMSQLSNRPVKTFSIGFEERSYNELDAAQQIATHFGTEHHEQIVHPNVHDLFEQVIPHFDEPFGDSSAIPTYLVCQHARQHVTVALSGTGADELFAGYERYWALPLTRVYTAVPAPIRYLVSNAINRLPAGHAKKSLIHRAQRFIASVNTDPITRHRQVIELFSQIERANVLHPHWHLTDPNDPLAWRFAQSNASTDLNKLLDVDIGTLLADDYLVKDDRMSMAVSLELRVPFLDHTLVEFAASLPPHLKLRRLTTKYILKRASRHLLPKNILRRPKQGFEMPVAHWLKTELRDLAQTLLTSPEANTLLNPSAITDLLDNHVSGRANNSRQIWSLMSLVQWCQTLPTVTKASPYPIQVSP